MRIIGLDPASTTGYGILDVNESGIKLQNFGTIISSFTNIGQRLNYLAGRISNLIETFPTDQIAIEDTIMGISGVRTLITLGRISGVVIKECYKYAPISMYTPGEWKKGCGLGLKGNAKKYEVQFAVIEKFDKLEVNILNEKKNQLQSILTNTYSEKLSNKEIKKLRDKAINNLCKELHSLSGIGFDTADAICIGLAHIEKGGK